MSKRRVGVENAGYGRLSGRNDNLVEVLRCMRMRDDEACGRLRKQKESHISSFLCRAASLFFATTLPDCGAHEGQADTSFCFEDICNQLENPPAFALIDQPPFPLVSRLR